MDIKVNPLLSQHWPAVKMIYQDGIETGIATFETSVPSWEEWDKAHLNHSRWVAAIDDKVVGWVALSPVSDRCAYGGVAEVSVYVSSETRGKGVGRLLLETVISSSESNGIWTLTAGMFRENIGSITLHRKCGFREIGFRERIGKLHGEWKDNIMFERRSDAIN